MGFNQGISGLNASAQNLSTIGNNIANASTVGFKSGQIAFKDVFAGSQIGLGVAVAGVVQDFTSGNVEMTNRPLDLAITGGNGFFRVTAPGSNEVSYTRNGQFNVDKDGYVVNTNGMQLTGFGVTATGAIAGGTPGPLLFPTQPMPPTATTSVVAQFNIDSRSAAPAGGAFDPTDPTTFNYSNALTVFDSLGNPHELALYFVKNGANTWDMYATADGTTLTDAGGADWSDAVEFDSNGNLTVPATGRLTFPTIALTNGAADLDMGIDLRGSTQFGNSSAVQKLAQDGYTSGVLSSFQVDEEGLITGKYSNDQSMSIGQIVLSSFANVNGLRSTGDNLWEATTASGQPLTGSPGPGSRLGSLTSGALEASNVDVTSELVKLIKGQQQYQANAQTLSAENEVGRTLLNIR